MKRTLGGLILVGLLCGLTRAAFNPSTAHPVIPTPQARIVDDMAAILDSSGTITLAVADAEMANPSGESFAPVVSLMQFRICTMVLAHFGKRAGFNLVERARLDSVLAEMKLTYSGAIAKGVQPGELLGVNYILFVGAQLSSPRGVEETCRITYRLVDVRTARIITQSEEQIAATYQPPDKD